MVVSKGFQKRFKPFQGCFMGFQNIFKMFQSVSLHRFSLASGWFQKRYKTFLVVSMREIQRGLKELLNCNSMHLKAFQGIPWGVKGVKRIYRFLSELRSEFQGICLPGCFIELHSLLDDPQVSLQRGFRSVSGRFMAFQCGLGRF